MSTQEELKKSVERLKRGTAAETVSTQTHATEASASEPTAQPPKHKGGRPRASGETKTARMTLNLKPSMMAEIERIASTRDTTPTTLVYEIVRDWITANNSE